MRTKNSLAYLSLSLAFAMVALVFLSWIITAAMPDMPLRSLLSAEGMRWFFGHFADNLATPLLVWMVLAVMAYGALREGGLLSGLMHLNNRMKDYGERMAMRLVVAETAIFLVVMSLLTLVPGAVLLSVTGSLFPSSFSQSFVPCLCFILCVMGVSYGLVSGRLHSLYDVFHSLTSGFGNAGMWFVVYVLAAELYFSVGFVFEL